MRISKFSILLGAALAGCTPEIAEWTPAESPKENKVERTVFSHIIHYSSRSKGFEDSEKRKLLKFLKAHVQSPGAVSIILEEYGDSSARRIKDIQRVLVLYGIPYGLITVEQGQACPDERKKIGSGVNLVLEKYLVIPPSCADFSQPIGDARQAYAPSNFGCADTANLGMMIANPRDLIDGRRLGPSDGKVIAAGVDRYRKDQVKALIDTSTTVDPGSLTNSGGASSSSGSGSSGGTGY